VHAVSISIVFEPEDMMRGVGFETIRYTWFHFIKGSLALNSP